ncbi:hypothetical protein MLGJGCBP_02129 [Rhodococcus sp. T7]|nr:hypothetical protein MLGJGCBP_02129 [Rhodococcus sp. T7]
MSAFCAAGQWIPAIGWAYDYAAVLGIALGFVGYFAILPFARRSSLRSTFVPSGTLGEELAELTSERSESHA